MILVQEQATIQMAKKTKSRYRPENHGNLEYDRGSTLKSLKRRQIASEVFLGQLISHLEKDKIKYVTTSQHSQ